MKETTASTSKLPRSAETIKHLFEELGIKNYEPQIIMQMTDLSHFVTKYILLEAQAVSKFANKTQIDKSDIEFAIKVCQEKFQPNRPSKMFLMDLATQKNNQPLLPIRQNYGLRLPNDRFCQVQPNFVFNDKPVLENQEQSIPSKNYQQGYKSYLSEMNTESVMMNLDSSQQAKRRKLLEEEQANEVNDDLMNNDDYYD